MENNKKNVVTKKETKEKKESKTITQKKEKPIVKEKKSFKEKDKKTLAIVLGVVLVLLFIFVLSVTARGSSKLVCTKKTKYEKGIKQDISLTYYYKKNKINKVDVDKKIKINKKVKTSSYSYSSVIKESLDSNYGKNKSYKSKIVDNGVDVSLSYSDNKFHILDDLIISIEDKSVSVNILSEDNYNSYANIDLSKNYSIKSVIRDLEKKNYTCK